MKVIMRWYWALRTRLAYRQWMAIPTGWADDWQQLDEQRAAKNKYERCLKKFFSHGGKNLHLRK